MDTSAKAGRYIHQSDPLFFTNPLLLFVIVRLFPLANSLIISPFFFHHDENDPFY
ncbi:hypothetical protein CHCC14427_3256 [Bacillus paralicheniformis]|nr:hypothetical protein CHCC14427_3256 [Bacillus paralicheniformis]